MKRVTAIRVPARYDRGGEGMVTAVAEFRLGLGPCGKTVEGLRVEHRRHFLAIVQRHDDGTTTEFLYARDQLTGRVEVQRG